MSKALDILDLDKWKKIKVEGQEVTAIKVAVANLPKPAKLGANVEGYSCVGAEVRGTKGDDQIEYFVYTMDSHRETYEKYGYSLTAVQTAIPPAVTAKLLATGVIKDKGVMMPEALDPMPFMDCFTKEGLPVFVEERRRTRM
jgi:saccharopine dehydrogenase (NAD+, L-lysine-forming)